MHTAAPPVFHLTEYEGAFATALQTAIWALSRARDPLLRQIRVETVDRIGTSRVTGDLGTVNLPPKSVGLELSYDRTDVIAGNLGALLSMLDNAADQHVRAVMPQFFEGISRITDATGNTVDAGGRAFSPELLLEALERIEWSFDENDEPIMPTLVMSPELAEKVSQLPPLTAEQEQAFADLKERKRAEYHARKRRRKLS